MSVIRIVALAVGASLLLACEAPAALPLVGAPAPREVTLEVRALGAQGGASGARICAASPAGAERCETADAKGEARLVVPAGTYFVRATAPEGQRLEPGVVPVVATEGVTVVVVPLRERSYLSGVVRDAAGRAVARANVCAHPASDVDVECALTAADGTFRIEARAAAYKVSIDGPDDGSRLLSQWARGRVGSFEADVFDARGGDVSGIEVALVRGVVLSGVVRGERDGAPVEGAQVCTQTLREPLPWDCERTDRDGRYAALREPGRYWVWVIPPDTLGSRLIAQRYDRVDLGVHATPLVLDGDRTLDVALRDGRLVRGRVVTDDGALVSSALVCIDTAFTTGRLCRPTDEGGRYTIATRPDTYVLQILPPAETRAVGEYWTRARTWVDAAEVRVADSDVNVDIVLRRGARLSGVVRTPDGIGVEGAPVNVHDAGGFVVGTYTDHRGHYAVGVPAGPLTVDVFAPRISRLVGRLGIRIDAERGGDVGIDVVLERAAP